MRDACAAGAGRRSVYLTFDDGPNPLCTPDILDLLAEAQASATFFVIGAYAADQSKLIRRMAAEGHGIANHTMTHPDLSRCGPGQVQYELLETTRAIRMACPRASVGHMRAPYGTWTEQVLHTSMGAGLVPVHWSIDPRDWSRPGVDAIVDRVIVSVEPGAIVLLHDGCPPNEFKPGAQTGLRDQTVMALSRLIPALHERGFQIRSLPQHH
ncbi:chitooligosaccharide deacetylase NodB [Mesorhizobium sp. WSM3224]|uniref:chitooligosaccharide deacetylase NodB n=1 Tax=Mesorhizobium sp. WSM3224 TaxID=1040986 RepID=UPI000488148A|nr:chitooligosaccharide deacetylase NodB [Mesorhizobium sp. WSM3224]